MELQFTWQAKMVTKLGENFNKLWQIIIGLTWQYLANNYYNLNLVIHLNSTTSFPNNVLLILLTIELNLSSPSIKSQRDDKFHLLRNENKELEQSTLRLREQRVETETRLYLMVSTGGPAEGPTGGPTGGLTLGPTGVLLGSSWGSS